MGPGLPLYLEFVILSTILLVFLFIVFGIWGLYTNIKENIECEREIMHCSNSLFNIISLTSKKRNIKLVLEQNQVCLATTIFLIFVIQKFRLIQQGTEKKCDDNLISPSDYTIMVENFTHTKEIDSKMVSEALAEAWKKIAPEEKDKKKSPMWAFSEKLMKMVLEAKFEVRKVTEAFELGEYIRLEQKRLKLQKTRRKKIYQIRQKLSQKKVKPSEIELISKKYLEPTIKPYIPEEIALLKAEFNQEMEIFLKKKKHKLLEVYTQFQSIERDWIALKDKMNSLVINKRCPVSFVTLNLQERKTYSVLPIS